MDGSWSALNEYCLLQIFDLLDCKSLANVSKVCRHWYFVANDEWLWKSQFCKLYNQQNCSLPPSSKTWKGEVKRLTYNVPSFEAKGIKLESHCEEITDICFSPEGEQFVVCGSDAIIELWSVKGNYSQKSILQDFPNMMSIFR